VDVAETNGQRPLYKVKEEYIEANWQRSIASFLPKLHIENQTKVTTEIVPCISLDTLLDNHRGKKDRPLQMDVEGSDYELLKSSNFDMNTGI
jgi:hypothetical protein